MRIRSRAAAVAAVPVPLHAVDLDRAFDARTSSFALGSIQPRLARLAVPLRR